MRTVQALVACSDLLGYSRLSSILSEEQIFHFISEYYEFIGDAITRAGGRVIKFMGDATLILFPESQIDDAVISLLAVQAEGDQFIASRGVPCKHRIRAHFGTVQEGEVGTRSEKRLDIIGTTVNKLFLLDGGEFAISPETFENLTEETRQLFRKHTPQVIYIPAK